METVHLEKTQLDEAIRILNQGGVLAFPTDTVYGIAVRYDNMDAVKRMKWVKGRDERKPFPFMASSLSLIEEVAVLNDRDYRLIEKWLPGALTFIFKKSEKVSLELTDGMSTIAVRMPDDEYVLKLISAISVPLLVTSANLSGQKAATSDKEVLAQLEGRITGVVRGKSGDQRASTIIDASGEELKVVREGKITLDDIVGSLEVVV